MASSWAIRNKISSKENERDRYEDRKREVTEVQNNIPEVSEDYVTKINKKIRNAKDEMHDAIKGIPYTVFFEAALIVQEESIGLSDSYLSNASSCLSNEISDCNKKIQALNYEISQLWTDYYVAVEEERKAWERLTNGIF